MKFRTYRIFILSILFTLLIVVIKFILHQLDWEVIVLGSLHTSTVAGAFFVIGFLLSTTMADYKESEKIPAEVAAAIENMYEDVLSIEKNYPKFNDVAFQKQLQVVVSTFAKDVRNGANQNTHLEIHKLNDSFAAMEKAGVPANFIVKLKQQQALIIRHLFRVNYIQKITFIPSATILAWSIVTIVISIMTLTEVEPFYGGMLLVGGISFIFIYMLQLIRVIRTPFHTEGATKDDISLFLLDQTSDHLQKISRTK